MIRRLTHLTHLRAAGPKDVWLADCVELTPDLAFLRRCCDARHCSHLCCHLGGSGFARHATGSMDRVSASNAVSAQLPSHCTLVNAKVKS